MCSWRQNIVTRKASEEFPFYSVILKASAICYRLQEAGDPVGKAGAGQVSKSPSLSDFGDCQKVG